MTNTIIAHSNTDVNDIPCVRICKEKKTAESFAAVEILTGSNELAADILKMNGFTSLNSDGFAEIHKTIEFYGVGLLYFTNLMNRYNICLKHSPGEVIKKYGETYLSARMILALCMLMQQGRNVPKDSKAKEIYLRLRSTRYYDRGWEFARNEKLKDKRHEDAQRKAEQAIREGLLDDNELPEITPDGRVLITVGGLAKLVGMMNTAPSYENSSKGAIQVSKSIERLNEAIEQVSPKTEGISCESSGIQAQSSNKRRGGRRNPIPVIATKDGTSTQHKSITACAKAIGGNPGDVCRALHIPHYRAKGFSIKPA